MAAPSPAWGTCRTCGDATPPGATTCPTCGVRLTTPTDAKGIAKAAGRIRLHRGLRVFLVIAVALVLFASLAYALYTGPPVAADPLTGTWTYPIGPGNFSVLSGSVTGGDYITGNFTVVTPPGAVVSFEVFNATEYLAFAHGRPAVPAQAPINETSGLIDFSALVTDTYDFVWTDGYSVASHIATTVFISTEYESNVVVE